MSVSFVRALAASDLEYAQTSSLSDSDLACSLPQVEFLDPELCELVRRILVKLFACDALADAATAVRSPHDSTPLVPSDCRFPCSLLSLLLRSPD